MTIVGRIGEEGLEVMGMIEPIPQVGDFVAFEEPLFALYVERDRLDRALEPLYVQPFDLELARIPDSQGLGRSSTSRVAPFR